MNMKNTIVINLFGAPGTGKSTLMAELFSKLKWSGVDCEMVTEFAKELVWANRDKTFKDEGYIFAKQAHRLFVVNGEVDVIITDRPLLLTIPYSRRYGNKDLVDYYKSLESLCYNTHQTYMNLNILLKRTKPYNPNGRNQSENEAKELHEDFVNVLEEFNIHYIEMDAVENVTSDKIIVILKDYFK